MTSLRHSLMLKKGGVISIVGAGGKTALMFRLARELSKDGGRVLTTTTTKIFMPVRKQSSIIMISESAETIVQHARELFKQNSHISAGSAILHLKNKLKGLKPETIDALWKSGVFRWIIVEADGAAGRPLKTPAIHEPVVPQSTRWLIGVVGLDAVGKPLTEKWAFRSKMVAHISGLAIGSSGGGKSSRRDIERTGARTNPVVTVSGVWAKDREQRCSVSRNDNLDRCGQMVATERGLCEWV